MIGIRPTPLEPMTPAEDTQYETVINAMLLMDFYEGKSDKVETETQAEVMGTAVNRAGHGLNRGLIKGLPTC